MKKISVFLLLITSLSSTYAQTLPDVPRKVDFAGVSIKLDADAQSAVQDEVKFLLLPENRILQEKLERLQWYLPVIASILEEEEVPDDFKYLAVVESSLMPDVVSTSNAVGYWQLKTETANDLGLMINSQVDERKNIYSSTKAAALYLKRNNLIYKNWISTLYSYYLGATGVSKLVPSEWAYATEIKLDSKTDRYIIKTIAHRIAFDYRLNRLRESPNAFVEYKNSKGKTLSQIASDLNIDATDLKKFNPWLNVSTIPTDKDYSVAILSPTENIERLQAKIKNIDSPIVEKSEAGFPILKKTTTITSSPLEPVFYEINDKKGILAQTDDDVNSLAQKGEIKVSKFLQYNDMNDKDLVKVGKVYYLSKKDKHAKVPFHTVSNDQTLWEISQMYGITMYRLLDYNRINTIQRLQTGRVLWLQKRRPKDLPIEYVIDKDKETTPNTEKNPKIEEQSKGSSTTTESEKPSPATDPDATTNTPASTTDTYRKTPIVILEEEPKANPVVEKPKKKEVPKTEVKPTPTKVIETPKTEEVVVLEDNTRATKTTLPTKTAAPSSGIHTVVAGETLYSIARTYNVSPKDLAAWNDFTIAEKVKIGQLLSVAPVKSSSTESPKTTLPPPSKVAATSHVVVKGETLFSIAKKYGVTMKEIQQWNGMTDQNVKIGEKIIVKK